MFEIEFYKDRQGNEPTKEYIAGLNKKAATSKNERIKLKKTVEYMNILKTYGTRAGEPYVKHIDGDVWELRPTDDRFFFFYWKNDIFVLLHHYIKKTNKAPQREIDQAKRNLKDFLERGSLNEE